MREERERLGMSQSALGELGGVRKQAQLKYESNARHPDTAYLSRVASYGVDVAYLITGQRSTAAPATPLSEGDRILLDNFHAAPPQVQAGVKTALGAFAPAPGKAVAKRPPKAG